MTIMATANPTAITIHTCLDEAVDGASLSSSRRNSLDEFKQLEKEVQQLEELSSEEADYNSCSSVLSGPPNTANNFNKLPEHTFSTANTSEDSPQSPEPKDDDSTKTIGSPRGEQQPDDHLAEAPASDLIYVEAEKVEQDIGSMNMQNLKIDEHAKDEKRDSQPGLNNPTMVMDGVSPTHLNTTLLPTTEVSQHFEATTPELTIQDQNQQQFEEEQKCGEKCQSPAANKSSSLASPSPSGDKLSGHQSKTKSASLTMENKKNCKCESIKKDPKLKTKVCTIL